MMKVRDDWQLNCVLDVLSFVFNWPCEDGILMLQHVVFCVYYGCSLCSVLLLFY